MTERKLGPDDFNCKKCGAVVRYATIKGARMGIAFEGPIRGGGYQLVEEETTDKETGEAMPTGRWIAVYTKVADRHRNSMGWRQHNCKPKEYTHE